MTNYTEHDDATIKIIGVKQGPRKMSIVHVMCVCVTSFLTRYEPSSRNLLANSRLSQATITIYIEQEFGNA